MSTQVQRRKGTTVQHSTFTGASAELTVDTTKNTVVVHDGATAGGIPLAKETGSALSATSLSLPNSTTNGVAYVNGSKVVVAGSTFTFDGTNLSVNNITVGKGAGSSSFNTAVGELALGANTSSATNTAVGYNAMKAITTGSGNTAVGAVALTLASDTGNNTAIGRGALFPSTGTQNTALGYNAGGSMSSGSKNVIIGSFSGNDISYGTGFDIRTLNNYIVLSDGDANVRAYWNGANPTFPGVLTLSDGTANGVPYLNGSKQITTGSALTFDGTNLGVGTSSAQSKLHIASVGADGTATARLQGNRGTDGQVGVLNFSNRLDISGGYIIGAISVNRAGDDNTGEMLFSTALGASTPSERMRLNSTGLGIGTSSPTQKLEVIGNQIRFSNSGNAAYYGYIAHDAATTGANLYNVATASGGGHQFQRGGTTQLNLDPAGNLGLGVTPSAWGSGFSVLQLESKAALVGNNGATYLGNNWYSNAGSKYIGTSQAALYGMSLGTHAWYNAPSGTAGDPIAFTQAMTLTAGGNLLVGTTSVPNTSGTDGVALINNDGVAGRIVLGKTSSGTESAALFYYSGSVVGSITYSDTATAYNTSSDYRLKNITGPITTSGEYIDSLNPVEGTWKADGSTFVGLIAHETQEASRTTVATGTKDGEEMQGMDYSSAEIIANLIAELQDLRKRLAAAGI